MTIKLLVCTEYFWPDRASTGRLMGELVGALKTEHPDWEIQVLTGTRVYRGGDGADLAAAESWNGIRIHRLRSLRSGEDSFWRRALSDLVFSLQVARRIATSRWDVVLVVTNPPIMPVAAAAASILGGQRTVYLIHDLYPDIPVALGLWSRWSPLVHLLRAAQTFALRRAARIVVLGEPMQDYLARTYGVRPERIAVIPNWATTTFPRRDGATSDPPAEFTVVYCGNLGRLHDFETMLDGAELLRDHPSIRFVIAGDGVRGDWLRGEVARRTLPNVVLGPFLSDAEFEALLRGASLGIISLEPGMEPLGVPSKTYNLLAAGLPLLAITGADSEVARLIRERHVGNLVAHGDARSFASIVLTMQHDRTNWLAMSANARALGDAEARLDVAARRYAREIVRAAWPVRR